MSNRMTARGIRLKRVKSMPLTMSEGLDSQDNIACCRPLNNIVHASNYWFYRIVDGTEGVSTGDSVVFVGLAVASQWFTEVGCVPQT